MSGDEIVAVETGASLRPGQIFNSNTPMLQSLLRSWGVESDYLGCLPDEPGRMKEILEKGLGYDFLITVGGVSMGRFDYMRECLRELGAEELFWKVNQKPGGPMMFAKRGGTLVFGLPGNPVSCYFCADLYLKVSLRRAGGRPFVAPPVTKVLLLHDLAKRHGKAEFLRGRLGTYESPSKKQLTATATGSQDSNILRSVTGHHGYIVFPPEKRQLPAGSTVEFLITDMEFAARTATDLLSIAPDEHV